MASTYKRVVEADIGTSYVELYEVPASTTSLGISLLLANTENSGIVVDVQVETSGDTIYLGKELTIPQGSTLQVLGGDKLILAAGDILKVKSDVATSVDAIFSFIEDVNDLSE